MKVFVSYNCIHSNGNLGYGNVDFDVSGKITKISEIWEIEKQIKESVGLKKVIVMNWQYFD